MSTILSRVLPEWDLTGSHSEKQAKFDCQLPWLQYHWLGRKAPAGSYFLMALKVYDIEKSVFLGDDHVNTDSLT